MCLLLAPYLLSLLQPLGNITEQLFRMCQELCMWKQLPSMNTQHIDPVMVFQHFVDVFYEYESYVDVNRPNSQLVRYYDCDYMFAQLLNFVDDSHTIQC